MSKDTVDVELNIVVRDAVRKIVDEAGETLVLALEMADEIAKLDVESFGSHEIGDGWVDVEAKETDWMLQRALRYIELRGEDFGYKIERDESLIRFSKKKIGQ